MSFVSKIEVVFATGSLKWSCAIDENDCVIYVVLFAEICEKLIMGSNISCWLKLCLVQIVRSVPTAAYSQYCPSLSQITVSSAVT